MYGFTKSIAFTFISSIVIGALAINLWNKNPQPTINDDGLNEYPMSATEYMLQRELETNAAAKAKVDAQEIPYYQNMTAPTDPNAPESLLADFTLPIVVHIVHQNGQENIDNSQVEDAIQHLNDAYENVGTFDQGTGVNTQIAFCLAKTNPYGDPTTGVTRTEDELTDVTIETEDLDLKNLNRWDPTKYINVWVVRSASSDAYVNNIRGYAYMPAFHGTDRDGIVMEAAFFGSGEEESKAFVREMGHYLGLYSTFHAGCGNMDCLMDGDRVCDTPPDWTIAEAPCEVEENSCFTDVNPLDANNPFTQDTLDMRENYMDINPLECQSAFTQGQTDRMTFFINNDRASLLNTTVCDNDCDSPIEDFAISSILNDTTVVINSGSFIVQSTSTNATDFNWTINGMQVPMNAGANYSFNPDSAGVFNLTLTASNSNASCSIDSSIQITVIDCFGNAWVDDATGTDVFMCGQPGSPCKTIQYALDNSVCSGDTIFIRSGTYSLPAATPTTTPIAVIPEDYTVTFFGVENNGAVIIDGASERSGFLYNYSGGDCPPVFPNNGIDVSHQINFAHLTIQNTFAFEQACPGGGSLAGGSAIFLVNDHGSVLDVSIDNCSFKNNRSIDADTDNDGRIAFGAVLFNGRVDDNVVPGTNSSLTITDSEFTENRAIQAANGGVGGALSLIYIADINISDSYFCENSVEGLNADAGDLELNRNSGGAIAIIENSNFVVPNNHTHMIENCYFFNNEATTAFGASFPDQSEGGALFLGGELGSFTPTSTAELTISNSSFYNNNIETGIEHFDNSVGTIVENTNTLDDNPFAFSLGNDTTICNIDSITIGTEILGAEFLWSTGATTSMITVGDTGVYVLTISMGACEFEDSIKISETICGEICSNGIDDDGDGLIDCFDPECCGQDGCELAFYNECPDDCEFSNIETEVEAEVKWQSNVTVSSAATPVVGDIDGDGTPEVIVPVRWGNNNNKLSIIDGLTGEEEGEILLPTIGFHDNIAIADVDKDGTAEVFYFGGGTLYRFEHDGSQTATFDFPGSVGNWSETPGLADFDGDGSVEVYVSNGIFSAADLTQLVTIPVTTSDAIYAVAVDVLEDTACPNCEGLEYIFGNRVYSIDLTIGGAFLTVEANLGNGVISIADYDKDGDLDGIVSATSPSDIAGSTPLIYAWELQDNTILGQMTPADNASPSALGDIDGDGQLEIVFKTSTEITALELDFSTKWTTPASEDDDNVTSPVLFDFDGDGDFEIVARGTDSLKIVDGTNGNIMYSTAVFSETRNEMPVIVDVDGDGLTEILVTGAASANDVMNDNGFVRAYTSSSFPWQTTRKVWNQNQYFNVQIQEDLSIPIVQQQHHIVGDDVVLNNYLAQHGEQLGADASIASVDVLCALNELIVTLEVCNTGDNELSHTTPISFYLSDPTTTNATASDTELLGEIIPVDSCAFVEFTIPAQYDDPVYVVINDDNTTNTPYDLNMDFPNTNIGECDYSNNMIQFTETPEPYELDLGGTITICDNASIVLNASTHFVSYEWQNGTTDSTLTVYDGGMYKVIVIDSCGGTQMDSVQIMVDPNTVNMTMPSNAIVCPTQDTSFTVMGDFDTFKWLPDTFLDCDTCQTVNVIDPDMEQEYIVTASNSLTGCYSVDTVTLSLAPPINTTDGFQVCAGEAVIIHGNSETAPGTYTETFTSVLGCDSISSVTLANFDELVLNFQTDDTCPEGSTGSVTVFPSNGTAIDYDWSVAGAGNNPTVDNLPAGIYTVTVTDANNCTSVGSTEVEEQTVEEYPFDLQTDFISPSCPGDSDGELEVTNPQVQWEYSFENGPFQTSPIFMDLAAGNYQIRVRDGDCVYTFDNAPVEDPAGIEILNFPSENQQTTFPDSFDVTGVTVNSANPIVSTVWSPTTGLSCTDCLNPSILHTSSSAIEYTLTVTDENGCSEDMSFTLSVILDCMIDEVKIPNAFTPDGDGVNDEFSAVTEDRAEEVLNLRIYNRWGNLVFESADGSEKWDGTDGEKDAPMDVYVYVMTIGCSAGGLDVRETVSGEVTLIR